MSPRKTASLSAFLAPAVFGAIGLATTATGCSDGSAKSDDGLAEQASVVDTDGGVPERGACETVLEDDLIAKANATPPNAAAVGVLRRHLFTLDVGESYVLYGKQYDAWKAAKRTGRMESILSVGTERKLTLVEYRQLHDRRPATDQAKQRNLIDDYASQVRSPQGTNAWLTCILGSQKKRIYAFGGRDAAGNAYIDVAVPKGAGPSNTDIGVMIPRFMDGLPPRLTLKPGTHRVLPYNLGSGGAAVELWSISNETAFVGPAELPSDDQWPSGTCSAEDVKHVNDSYLKVFGFEATPGHVAGWCGGSPVSFENLVASHSWYLTTPSGQDYAYDIVRRAYALVVGASIAPGSKPELEAQVRNGKTFAEIAQGVAKEAKDLGALCVDVEWETSGHTMIPLCGAYR